MHQCSNPTLNGRFYYNGQEITLPSPMSFAAMQEKFGDIEITSFKIGVNDFGYTTTGSTEALNEFLDFTVERIPAYGLSEIIFSGFDGTLGYIEPAIQTVLVSKCIDLYTLKNWFME